MSLPENDYQILKLTDDFYNAYPNPPYREILKKKQRAYNCILFQTHYDYYICVPYRSEISHTYAYLFKKSVRMPARCCKMESSPKNIGTPPSDWDTIIIKDFAKKCNCPFYGTEFAVSSQYNMKKGEL